MLSPDSVQITAHRPLGTEVVSCQAPEGLSISEMLWNGLQPPHLPYTIQVWVDGRPIPCELLDSIRPKAGSLIMIRTLPKSGNDLLRAVLMIAVVVAAAYGQIWASAYFGSVAAGIGAAMTISAVGFMLVNALVPPQLPAVPGLSSDILEAPTMWVSGARNQENRWGTVPVVLGVHRTIPFYAAKPYTEIEGNDQYFVAVYCIGYGPLQLTDFRMGETPIREILGHTIEYRPGYSTDAPISLYPKQVNEESFAILLEAGVWQSKYTEPNTDEFSIDWAFLSGLCQFDDGGNRQERTVQLDGRYRNVVGPGAWYLIGEILDVFQQDFTLMSCWPTGEGVAQERWDLIATQKVDGKIRIVQGIPSEAAASPLIPDDCWGLAYVRTINNYLYDFTDLRQGDQVTGMEVTFVAGLTIRVAAGTVLYNDRLRITGRTSQALRGSLSIHLPARGQYEVQLQRVTADSTDPKIIDLCTWITLRSIRDENPINFPFPLALVALRIKATDQMGSYLNEFNCIAASIIPDYDPDASGGPEWIERVSANPASLYRYILQGPPNARPLSDGKLNLEWFEDFWQFCRDNDFRFNAVLASARAVYDQCLTVCAAGRATPQMLEGQWAGVIDREIDAITGHYTPHNSWGFEFTGSYPDFPHAFRVRFLDETNGWKELERIVYADGYDEGNATLFESVDQVGITNPTQIWKLWQYNLSCAKFRAFPFSFYVDWEHLTNTRGDLIRATYYELTGQVFTGRIKNVEKVGDNHILTLDNAVITESGKDYFIRIRLESGISITGDVVNEDG